MRILLGMLLTAALLALVIGIKKAMYASVRRQEQTGKDGECIRKRLCGGIHRSWHGIPPTICSGIWGGM